MLKETGRLEAEIRDLQVQAGHLALLESRKSIELSIRSRKANEISFEPLMAKFPELTCCSKNL